MVAGGSADTSHRPVAMTKVSSLHLAFHIVSAIEVDCIQFSILIVHFHRHCFFHCNRCCTCIFQAYHSGDHIKMRKYTIEKMCFQSADTVCQNNFQCLCLIFLCKHCRKPFQAVLSFCDLIGLKFQICSITAVCLLCLQAIDTIITISICSIFLWQGI